MPDYAGLETILDQTHAAVKAGDLALLTSLSERAEMALSCIGSCDVAMARRLQDKARRNDRLIAAALKGVKAARQRARDLTTQGRFSTYDAGGRRDQVGLDEAGPSRRL